MIHETCSHGIPWDQECPKCALIMARETVRHFGRQVDEARAVIEAQEKEEVKV